jgi:predicted DNA-binding transcriptional regulator AlpA
MGKLRTKAVPEMPGFITEAVLAGRIGVSEKSMWRKRRMGQAPVATVIGRQIFYSDADVAEWIAKCRQVKPPSRTRRITRRISVGRTRGRPA